MGVEIIGTIANSAISLLGIVVTAIVANSITKFRITELEKKVEKHNGVIERVYKLEQKVEDID